MVPLGLSIIAFIASYTHQPCEQVFKELAWQQMSFDQRISEHFYMEDLAREACLTTNPDIVWQIAFVETKFSFEIVRFNTTNQVLRGSAASQYLERLNRYKKSVNIDIGVMQVNWYWHRKVFQSKPLKMVLPSQQVRYLVEHMAPIVIKSCGKRWLGCYHNPGNGPRAERYNEFIDQSRHQLRRSASIYLRDADLKGIPLRQGMELSRTQRAQFNKIAYTMKQPSITYKMTEYRSSVLAWPVEPKVDHSQVVNLAKQANVESRPLEDMYLKHFALILLTNIEHKRPREEFVDVP